MPTTLTVVATIEAPVVPNYFVMSNHLTIPIEGVTDEDLREIGEAWTEELIAKAQRRRATPQEDG